MTDEAKEIRLLRKRRQRELQRAMQRRREMLGKNRRTPPMQAAEEALPFSSKPSKRKAKPKLKDSDISGLKYFDKLAPLLERLHDDACQRDKAGKRQLHFDRYCLLILLYMFNPIVTSLRGIQQASELQKVQKKLGCPQASLGSLSEAASVFDAQRLKEIIAELGEDLKPLAGNQQLKDIEQTLVLVDGTLIAALPKIMEASWRQRQDGSGMVKWRLHAHLEVDRYVPTRIDVTPDGGGEDDGRAVLQRTIESDRLYVMDRGYAKFSLFNAIVAAKSSYVCRLRDNSAYEVVEQRELTAADRAAGVLSDQIVLIGQSGKANARPDHQIRLVCVKCSPHASRDKCKGTSTGPGSDGVLRIATNLLDVPAEIVALLYAERWSIEIFFRFFKHLLGCRHLLSHNQNGIEIQTYCAIIACLLISLWTGRQPLPLLFSSQRPLRYITANVVPNTMAAQLVAGKIPAQDWHKAVSPFVEQIKPLY